MNVMQAHRLHVSPALRARMGYRRFAGETPRMLVLRSDYWLDIACLNGARKQGWQVAEAAVPQEGRISRDGLATMLDRLWAFKPDFILTVNMAGLDAGGLLAGLFDDLCLHTVGWFVDNPRTILPETHHLGLPHMVALTWERAYVPFLEAQGFGFVNTLPLATDPTVFSKAPNEAPSLAPAFVGNSMTDFARREWRWFEPYPGPTRALAAAFDENRITRDAFAQGLHACLPKDAVRSMSFEQRQHAEMVCFIEATRRLRVEGALRLLSEGLHVYGDDAWREYLTPERCHSYLNYTNNMPAFYHQCEVNVNITSIQMQHAVNQRVFDCPAAGGFLLSDAQADSSTLFEPDSEAAVYHSWDECLSLLRFYRRHPASRMPIIQKAQRRILAEHTYAHRLGAIVSWLKTMS